MKKKEGFRAVGQYIHFNKEKQKKLKKEAGTINIEKWMVSDRLTSETRRRVNNIFRSNKRNKKKLWMVTTD